MSSHLVIVVVRGAMAGRKFRIAGPAVVGRSPLCDIPLDDAGVSREHCEFVPEGDHWRLKDRGSRNGTSLNGEVVKSTIVRPGDEITLGEVLLRLESPRVDETSASATPTLVPIRLFSDVEPTLSATAAAPPPDTLAEALALSLPASEHATLYAVIDGSQSFDLAFAARLMGHDLYTLFTGTIAEMAAPAGPCLVVLGERSAFLRRWAKEAGSHSGVLFESTADIAVVGAHLRSVFVATDEAGQEYFFRFYDPRVLRVFLPTCREEELREFFGPVERWIGESEDGGGFTTFTLDGPQLRVTPIAARSAASS